MCISGFDVTRVMNAWVIIRDNVPTKHSCLHMILQPERPAAVRARAVKSELSDVEGLGFKLEERQKDILELKRILKLKVN